MEVQILTDMPDVIYAIAKFEDWEEIAAIHSLSWKENYRGMFSDEYLDNRVEEDRRELWLKRMTYPPHNQTIIVAKSVDKILGFSCFYTLYKNYNQHYLDNLHVRNQARGNSIGAELLKRSATLAFSKDEKCSFYLLVFLNNHLGIKFYKRMGATISPPFLHQNFDGSEADIVKCTWNHIGDFKVKTI